MKADGSDRQSIDTSGWGTQWSPDGKWIAYGKGGNITLWDVANRKSRPLLTEESATRYSYIYWNLGWSHDSRAVGFKGRRRTTNQDELAVAKIDSPDGVEVLQKDAKNLYPDVTFSPDNESVIVGVDIGSNRRHQLHAFNRKQQHDSKVLEIHSQRFRLDGASWSHDGKMMAIIVMEAVQPTEWVTGMK